MMAELMPRDDVLNKLNTEFIKEDAAIIQDVAAIYNFDYDKSHKALSDLFGPTSLAPSVVPTVLEEASSSSRPSNISPEDQQTVPEMKESKLGKDQSVPDGVSYAGQAAVGAGTGPKPNTGAIRKTPFTLKNNRKAVKVSANKPTVDRVKRMLMEKWNILIILRGLPGCGKSFLSKELVDMASECGFVYQICSADAYFQKGDGRYVFNKHELSEAHNYSQQKARMALVQKTQMVIVDNTNLQAWEMQPYVLAGVQQGYHIELLEPLTGWKFNVGQLREKNKHGVDDVALRKMKDRYERYDAETLLVEFKLTNMNQKVLSDIPVPLEPKIPPAVATEKPKIINNQLHASPLKPVENLPDLAPSQSIPAIMISANPNESTDLCEEDVIDYEGVPEEAREMYKSLPELYPGLERNFVRKLFRDSHFEQDYFFEMMENSAKLLEKNNGVCSDRPLVTPIRKEVKMPQTSSFPQELQKKVQPEVSAASLALKKEIEAKVFIPRPKKEEKKPPAPVILETEFSETIAPNVESPQSSDAEEFDAVLDKDLAVNLLLNYGGPLAVEDLDEEALKIKLPPSVALKIHSLWMESLKDHLDRRERNVQIQLDHDCALALRLSEEQPLQQAPKPNMDDIIEMEKALAAVKKCQIGESKNDLATKMSLKKLFEEFPLMDPTAIEELFEANARDYNQTVQVIRTTYGTSEVVKNVFTPEALKLKEEELIEQAKAESLKFLKEADSKKPLFVDVVPIKMRKTADADYEKLIEQISQYREEAHKALKSRSEALRQSEDHLKRKMHSVANYYSQIAQSWDAKYHEANSMVPNLILANASPEFLDLHYVYVPEALEVLDMFLDWHIERRANNPGLGTEMVEIVTGRGLRSEGGKPKIKPAVIKRLKDRGVKFEEANPGALRVFITRSMQFQKSKKGADSDED